MTRALTDNWGNPSSLHAIGDRANQLLEDARRTLAEALSCKPAEVIFTAGGIDGSTCHKDLHGRDHRRLFRS